MKKRLIFFIIAGIVLLGGCTQSGTGQQSQNTGSTPPAATTAATTAAPTTASSAAESSSAETSKQAEESGTKEVNLEDLKNVFGFAGESGKNLITIPGEKGNKLENPQEFNVAVGNNGEIVKIKFVKRQEANSKDTLRQTPNNFDNMAGYIYEAQDGKLVSNKTYLLSKDTVINENVLVKLISTRNMESQTDLYKKADAETIGKIEAAKNRKIIENSLISETEDHAKLCLVVFERQGDDMLASVVYIKGDQLIFKDYPAKYDEQSTWRVDAGDRPGLFEVLFLANAKEGLLLGLTWAGPEGENISVLKEMGDTFQETALKSSRYWSP